MLAYDGGSITLIGQNTAVYDNSTKGDKDQFGLRVSDSPSSTIQLVHPLTKEDVSTDNKGGGNWGADDSGANDSGDADINQIKTIRN